MKEFIFILSLFILACSSEVSKPVNDFQQIVCDDGRKVIDQSDCLKISEPATNPDAKPQTVEVYESEDTVASIEDAKNAFKEYVQSNGYDYTFVSAVEVVRNGKDYFKVVYRYTELSGGKRLVYIDSSGKVYEEYEVV